MTLPQPIVVFGGTGFLGRRVVQALSSRGATVRIAVRHASRARNAARLPQITVSTADVTDRISVERAVSGTRAVVNCVGLYHEHGELTFDSVHAHGAATIAETACSAGVKRLVSLSGIGADPQSSSPYVAARGRGEQAVRKAFPNATIFRPSVMFGKGKDFLSTLSGIVARSPIMPLFGDGSVRLQPVLVDDVAEAIARALEDEQSAGETFEVAGPDIVSFRTLVTRVALSRGRSVQLVPVPLPVWNVLSSITSPLRRPPITEGQVALMRHDNIADSGRKGLEYFGIAPASPLAAIARGA